MNPKSETLTSLRYIFAGLIVVAALAAYSDGFLGPFIYDDLYSISNNPTIRHFLSAWLPPEGGLTVSGRPIVNLSFALNYALGGFDVWGYHAFNVAIHILAGLALFGVARRSFLLPALRARFGSSALPLAFAVALIWTLHPLQTEAVDYVVQRSESLMGLFYLLTMYCFIRAVDSVNGPKVESPESRERNGYGGQAEPTTNYQLPTTEKRLRFSSSRWMLASVAACLLGMGCKENMVSAPVMLLFYDRTFIAGSFREAWRGRKWFYGCLAVTWFDLGFRLIVMGGSRDSTSGFGVPLSWWKYESTQFQAVAHYLWLAVWPHPLVFDYGVNWSRPAPIMPYAAILAGLVVGTAIAWWRRPALGFLGIFFFAILAPTSLMPGTTQVMVEHRMYLPLAAVIIAIVGGAYVSIGARSIPFFLAASIVLGFGTWRRNQDYHTAESIWADTVAKRPESPVAVFNLGCALSENPKRLTEAIDRYRAALRIEPTYRDAHFNLATVLFKLDRIPESLEQFQEILWLRPDDAEARDSCGLALMKLGRTAEAIEQYRAALKLGPGNKKTHNNLGIAWGKTGQLQEAIEQFEAALRIDPAYAGAHNNLGYAFLQSGRGEEALEEFKKAILLDPNNGEAHNNLAITLDRLGRINEAVKEYQEVLRLEPGYFAAHYNIGNALAVLGRRAEAVAQLQETLRLKPDYGPARDKLAQLLAQAPESTSTQSHSSEF